MEIAVNKNQLENVQTIVENLVVYTERVRLLASEISGYFESIADINNVRDPAARDIIYHQDNIRCYADMITEYAVILEDNREKIETMVWEMTCSKKHFKEADPFAD